MTAGLLRYASLAFLASVLLTGTSPAFAATYAWGHYTDHQFTLDTVVGMRASVKPYWANPVAWGGFDKSILFASTVFSLYYVQNPPAQNPGYQVGLVARSGSQMLDVFVQFPGDPQFTTTCVLCKDGTLQHELKIARISSPGYGWTMYVDGSSVATETCSCLNGDIVAQSVNQEPYTMEVATGELQAHIDQFFRVAKDYTLDYQKLPVGTGAWVQMPNVRAYYSKQVCGTDSWIGTDNAPSWAAVNDDGAPTTKTGTTTYLVRHPCSTLLW